MRQPLLLLLIGLWAVGAAAEGDPIEQRQNYRTPAGPVYTAPEITPEKARELTRGQAVLTLLKVTEISPAVADSLVNPYPDTFLTLPALESIDVQSATKLSRHRGHLRLWGIKSLTPEVAAALVASPGLSLQVTGVRDISPDVARALAGGKREQLGLGLPSLSADIAEALAAFRGRLLRFPRLESLSLDAAVALAKHRGSLDLGPARISPEVAEALLEHDGPLGLTEVAKLEPGVGEILARHRHQVWLAVEEIDSVALAHKLFSNSNSNPYTGFGVSNLKTLSPDVAAVFAAQRHSAGFEQITSLTPAAAAALSKHEGHLYLDKLVSLSPELARSLTDRARSATLAGVWGVTLRGVEALDTPEAVEVAKALASTSAPVNLPNLRRVSAAALAELRKKPTIKLPAEHEITVVD